ncbi:pentatricopeptide repeat-containing protein ELI1, chloroplastic-like [Selaginella moellendorffii]|uniref:pentatricopeptide repeat-containing protein ELI1, chloroplastic-like n=1 Tax=Selaginella moellendorffii TaxID=88036 RepID=UPI000D1C942C|nr:pentatricopeptide repeat-containing protein ELI1, chloroplastic-like [Selaginella moellendorffii]|eukprot:XP_024514951.1 pentatricopeptide repeat-containing protein ELI1, chloroplastic-like [Selaginella moellendorffii]
MMDPGARGDARSGSAAMNPPSHFHEGAQECRGGQHPGVSCCSQELPRLQGSPFRCGSLVDARRIFDTMPHHSLVSWSVLIGGYSQNGEGSLAVELFLRIQEEGSCQPDSMLFVAALNACSSLAVKDDCHDREDKSTSNGIWLEKGKSIHDQLRKDGHESNLYVANSLVDMYSKLGSVEDARIVFEGMVCRNVVTWGALILGYAYNGQGETALAMFSRMEEEGCDPDSQVFIATLKACIDIGEKEVGEMVKGKVVKTASLEKGRVLHAKLSLRGYEAEIFVANTLLDMYCKCGSMVEARRVFERMPSHSLVSWDTLINGYSQSDEGELALELFKRMEDEGFVADTRLFMAALRACGSIAALEAGRRIHAQVSGSLLETDVLLANSLVSFYAKCGSMDDAKQVFDSIGQKDMVSWTALIAGYSHQGDSKQVFELFERMQKERVKPNGVTYLSVLTVCSHAGLVDQGKRCFEAMNTVHSISPSLEHYICVIDLLGRGNQLEQALSALESMPYKPTLVAWRTVLSAARKWKNVSVGRLAFESILRLDDKDDAAYLLMANTYAAAGLWEDFARVEAMRKEARCWKKLGQSWWIDSAGKVHRFVVGDTTHHQSEQILAKLGELQSRIKEEAGCTPNLDCVVRALPDNEKESALCGHSERLAICCALINTQAGTAIRIIKNLRVCEDCHRITSIISKLERRAIICRDAVRFHLFEDGCCSCREFW